MSSAPPPDMDPLSTGDAPTGPSLPVSASASADETIIAHVDTQRSDAALDIVEAVTPKVIELRRIQEKIAFTTARSIINEYVVKSPRAILPTEKLILVSAALRITGMRLPGYATLDFKHLEQISTTITKAVEYIGDSSRRRPQNILILAAPGSGKSHLAKTLASHFTGAKIGFVSYNMANLHSPEDFARAVDAARSVRINEEFPVLFLDEFDSSPAHFALLLPVMWDGTLSAGDRELNLGKVVIVLAGSSSEIPDRMTAARSMTPPPSRPSSLNAPSKIPDVLSRINGGVIEIPSIARGLATRADRVVVAVQLLKNRFGAKLRYIPRGLLYFIANASFRYDVRSITHLIEMIKHKAGLEAIDFQHLNELPLTDDKKLQDSSLAYHLTHRHGVLGLVKLWHYAFSEKYHGRDPVLIHHPELDTLLTDGWLFSVKTVAQELLMKQKSTETA